MVKVMEQINILTQNGLKVTKPRVTILNILEHVNKPLTAEEIYLKLQKIDKSINLSTVYRVLEVFIKNQIITKPFIKDDNKASFIINHHEHKHFLICSKCQKMVEIGECPFKTFEKSLEKETNFTITNHRFELFGICPNCK